jgi:hypothetical protein
MFVALFILYFTQPNFYRAFTPQLFGIDQVAPHIFTDQPNRAAEIQRAVDVADKNAAAFFPNQTATPSYIVCFSTQCADVFGRLPLGLTLGYHRVVISPDGFNQRVFNHERIHVDLHSLTDIKDAIAMRYPAWFNEGLAEYLSGSNCRNYQPRPFAIDRVKQAETSRQWNEMVSDKQFRRHYGTACRAVEKIVKTTGLKRLSQLVHDAIDRRQFVTSLP